MCRHLGQDAPQALEQQREANREHPSRNEKVRDAICQRAMAHCLTVVVSELNTTTSMNTSALSGW
eukprot:2115520-Heterocapsa_arctica.AAC.1